MKIISGSSHEELAKKIAREGKFGLVAVDREDFKNGEVRVWIRGEIEGEHVAIVQTLSQPVDRHIVELLLLIDAARRMHPKRITVVLPWMGYSLQDKVFRPGEPISAKVVAKMIGAAGADDAVLMDLHTESIAGFFDVPVKYLTALPLFAAVNGKKKFMVVSPDFGAAKRAREFAKLVGAPLAVIDKERSRKTGKLAVHGISRSVRGQYCLVIDDMINTGSTVKSAAETLAGHGAKDVTFCATHGLFVGEGAWENVNPRILNKVCITDTVPISIPKNLASRVTVLSTAPLFARALKDLAAGR